MLIYLGKAKNYSLKHLLYMLFWVLARPIERLEPEDFGTN